MPSVGISRKEPWRVAAICLAVFLLSAGARLIEYPRWDHPGLWVDGERLLATHDAYFWVAGAEGVNKIAEPMPMAVLLKTLAWIFPEPVPNLAFWASILLAALVSIPIALWGYFLGAPYAALIAPILATLAPALYNRTRLGFYDTDWASLFFPLLISWLMAVWIQPHLRSRTIIPHNDPGEQSHGVIPAILIVLTAVAIPWHNFIGLYLIALLGLAAMLVILLGTPETRSVSFLTLLVFALVIGAGWIGGLVGILVLWWIRKSPKLLHHPRSALVTGMVLVFVLTAVTGIQFREYLAEAIPAYAGKLFGVVATQPSGLALVFPTLSASVRETQRLDLGLALEGMAYHPVLGVAGILGLLVLLRKKPTTVFFFPMFLLGLGSVRLGIRFAMFASPVILLGLLVPLDWFSAQAEQKFAWGKRVKVGAALLLILILTPRMDAFTGRMPVETVLSKAHAEALKRLREVADPAGTIWTWWDYGYASQHFTGLETFADGRRNTGDYLFSMGTVLGADTLTRSTEFLDFAVRQDFKPWEAWNTWSQAEWVAWLDGLGRGETSPDPLPAPQYLVVQWEGIPALPWIQYFGSWDIEAYEGQRSRVSRVVKPLELELETGIFRFDENQVVQAVTIDLIGDPGGQHYEYPENAGGPHLLLNNTTGEVQLLDETAYRSTFTQLLILPDEQLGENSPFKLLVDAQPFVRIFELR